MPIESLSTHMRVRLICRPPPLPLPPRRHSRLRTNGNDRPTLLILERPPPPPPPPHHLRLHRFQSFLLSSQRTGRTDQTQRLDRSCLASIQRLHRRLYRQSVSAHFVPYSYCSGRVHRPPNPLRLDRVLPRQPLPHPKCRRPHTPKAERVRCVDHCTHRLSRLLHPVQQLRLVIATGTSEISCSLSIHVPLSGSRISSHLTSAIESLSFGR